MAPAGRGVWASVSSSSVFLFGNVLCSTNESRRGEEKEEEKNSPAPGAAEARLTQGSAGQRGAAAVCQRAVLSVQRGSWFQAWGFACFSLALTGCLNLVNKQFENDWGKIIFSLKPRFQIAH